MPQLNPLACCTSPTPLTFGRPVLVWVRRLGVAAAFSLLLALAPWRAVGQSPPTAPPRAEKQPAKPKKIWTEEDLSDLWKPWDLYQLAQEKKLILGVPALSQTPQSPAAVPPPAPRMMYSNQFSRFLKKLDADAVKWETRLRNIALASLGVQDREQKEIERSRNFCLQALENVREDIGRLSREQTLKLQFLLLIDLNALARNLDGLSVNLASPVSLHETTAAKESLEWAKEVLGIDEELALYFPEFQYHLLALAELRDAAAAQAEQSTPPK